MKTPREILTARHQAATPKLDDVRRAALNNLHRRETTPAARPFFFTQLAEFFRLPKPALAGLALAWCIIILLNVASSEVAPASNAAPAQMAQRPTATREELRAQKQLFAELVGGSLPQDTEAPRPAPAPARLRRRTGSGRRPKAVSTRIEAGIIGASE